MAWASLVFSLPENGKLWRSAKSSFRKKLISQLVLCWPWPGLEAKALAWLFLALALQNHRPRCKEVPPYARLGLVWWRRGREEERLLG